MAINVKSKSKPSTITAPKATATVEIPIRITGRERKQPCLKCGKSIPKGSKIAQITSPITNKKTWIHATCVEQTKSQPSGVDNGTLQRLDDSLEAVAKHVTLVEEKAICNEDDLTHFKNVVKELTAKVDELEKAKPIEVTIDLPPMKKHKLPKGQLFIQEFDEILKLCAIGENVYLAGPTQCGKTFLANQIATALKRPFHFMSCFDEMTAGDLFGRQEITDGMKMEWVDGEFTKAYENGGVFLLDEMDAGNEVVMTALNAALAGDMLALPKRKDKPIAKKHKNFVCIAAANTWGSGATREYCGRNQLDGATLQRFESAMVDVDYNPQLEKKLAAPEIYDWLIGVRKCVRESRIRRNVTTRSMVRFSEQLKAGFTMDEIKTRFYRPWSTDELAKLETAGVK